MAIGSLTPTLDTDCASGSNIGCKARHHHYSGHDEVEKIGCEIVRSKIGILGQMCGGYNVKFGFSECWARTWVHETFHNFQRKFKSGKQLSSFITIIS
uniref:Uncharacterized protein n=1 Tax=Romanomermis culicivorax TaxID=13658 RepID=A0A915IHB0_ROMCU